jgi:hypothetical protein
MRIQKKIWETPSLKDLNVSETESGTIYAPSEATSYSPSGVVGGPTPSP